MFYQWKRKNRLLSEINTNAFYYSLHYFIRRLFYSVKLLCDVSVRLEKKVSEHFSCFDKLFLSFGFGDGLGKRGGGGGGG